MTAKDTLLGVSGSNQISRQKALRNLLGIAGALFVAPSAAKADVSDGTSLPEGAAQFSRVLRLKTDLQGVKKRVTENADQLDKKEWDNIGKFLRSLYAAGEDLKAVASGIFDPDNKKRATEDIALIKKYAQAGDVPVSKGDATNFLPVLDKIIGLLDDFLDSLSDVPDEI
jgi:hypothetical protein